MEGGMQRVGDIGQVRRFVWRLLRSFCPLSVQGVPEDSGFDLLECSAMG